jgi:hypothetical protein
MQLNRTVIGAAMLFAGCGGESKPVTPAPAMKMIETPSDEAKMATDGAKAGGENAFGPKRADADKKIAEIRANAALSAELKQQLVDEVERTYKAAQEGSKKN